MRNILQLLIFLTSSVLLAQYSQSIGGPTKKVSELEKYIGSIYLHKEYQKANVRLKYNIYTDALEHKKGDELYEVIKTPTTYAKINDDYFYYRNFNNQHGHKKRGYYALIESNDMYRVYKKYDLKITEPKEMNPMTGSSASPGKIKIISTLFLEEDGIIQELPMNKKNILLVFDDKATELKEYIQKEKIRVKKEGDLMKLVARYKALKNMDISQPQSLLSNTDQNN